jgi:hypothetical protein
MVLRHHHHIRDLDNRRLHTTKSCTEREESCCETTLGVKQFEEKLRRVKGDLPCQVGFRGVLGNPDAYFWSRWSVRPGGPSDLHRRPIPSAVLILHLIHRTSDCAPFPSVGT